MQALDQSKKVVDVLADLGGALEKVVGDKGGMFSKLGHLVPLSGDVLTVAGIDFSALKAEIAGLDDAGKAALLAEFKAKFDLADDQVEAKIEEGLSLAMSAEAMVVSLIAFAKSLKPAAQ